MGIKAADGWPRAIFPVNIFISLTCRVKDSRVLLSGGLTRDNLGEYAPMRRYFRK